MANPILGRADAFTRRAPQAPAYPQYGMPGQPTPAAGAWPQQQWGQPSPMAPVGVMTLDDVIAKTGLVLGVLAASAAVSFRLLDLSLYVPALLVSGLVGFVTVLMVSARKAINPALVVFYALVEGVFIGAFTRLFDLRYPGIASQAVIGTFAAAGCTLAAYRFLGIRVSSRMRRMVFLTTAAFAGVMLVNLLLALLGVNTGLRGMGPLGFIAALLGAGLAVLNLIVDFDDIQRGIQGNAPANESWRAAFGLTVTMVWLYTEILRLLGYLRR